MTLIRRSVRLDVPQPLAFQGLREALADIAAHAGRWHGFALHVDLGDAALPDVGHISVPIVLEVSSGEGAPYQLGVAFQAQRHPESFPAFKGAVGIDSTGPTEASIWLAGKYDVPMGAFGRIVDGTLLRGIAERALENLLGDVVLAVRDRIDEREAEYMRYRTFVR
jgi:hypothetical protein